MLLPVPVAAATSKAKLSIHKVKYILLHLDLLLLVRNIATSHTNIVNQIQKLVTSSVSQIISLTVVMQINIC